MLDVETCTKHGEEIAVLKTRLNGMDGKLDEILGLARATNGRVRRLEQWRSFLTGGVVITLSVMSGAFAILRWVAP